MVYSKQPMLGTESLIHCGIPISYTVLDFWRWSASDLLSNTTRGRFAEFIVATAIGLGNTDVRDEWANYDLQTPEGIKVEVKSAAYLQSWQQKKKSKILFKVKPTYAWDFDLDKRSKEKKLQADVYVFCLLNAEDKWLANPIDMEQWEFYILTPQELFLNFSKLKAIPLKLLKEVTTSVTYSDLRSIISRKGPSV